MFSVREFMRAIAEELAERGTSARDVLALQFEAESGDFQVVVGREPHPATYPALEEIFEMVSESRMASPWLNSNGSPFPTRT